MRRSSQLRNQLLLETPMTNFKFVRVKVTYNGVTIDSSAYQNVVLEHAAQGWDLVQIFVENPAACATEHVLIFKQPVAA